MSWGPMGAAMVGELLCLVTGKLLGQIFEVCVKLTRERERDSRFHIQVHFTTVDARYRAETFSGPTLSQSQDLLIQLSQTNGVDMS